MMLASLIALALLAAASPLLARMPGRTLGIVAFAVPFALGCWFTTELGVIASGAEIVERYAFAPQLDANVVLRLDGLAYCFTLLILFVGSFVLLYAGSYMAAKPRRGQFFATLVAFTTAMLGLVLADNLILLFIFWELTSITSFLLIGFDDDRLSARKSALQALLVTGLGGLALLAGLILMGIGAGTFELSQMSGETIRESGLYTPAVILVLLGCFTKSAQFPFHFWLPNAMEAPSPVSALLHSSTMVKAGVFLVMRLHPTLGGDPIWNTTLIAFGGFTMLAAAYLATRRREFKKVLAYTTVSSLGTIIFLVGLDEPKAAAAYLIAHALYKASLFLIAGSVVKKTGEKNVEKLSGLFTVMPIAAGLALVASASMAGFFPLVGFTAKELLIKGGLHGMHGEHVALLTVGIVTSAVFMVAAGFLVGWKPFVGPPSEHAGSAREPDAMQLAGPAVFVTLSLIAGLAPSLFFAPMVKSVAASIEPAALVTYAESAAHADAPALADATHAAEGVAGTAEHADDHAADHAIAAKTKLSAIELLIPPTTATWLSIIAIVLGFGLYAGRAAYAKALAPMDALDRVGPERAYTGILAGTLTFAAAQTKALQSGSLRWYVRITLITLTGIAGAALFRVEAVQTIYTQLGPMLEGVTFMDAVIAAAIIVGAIATTMQRQALAAVAVLGLVGFMSALFFVTFGAPDVASTQFAVETLVVVIFVLVVFHLPRYRSLTTKTQRVADWVLASAFGLLMGTATLLAAIWQAPTPVSEVHAALSYPEAYGKNIVNVILVDFRAFDTLGEIFVVGVAAVGVYTLIRLRSGNLWTIRGTTAPADQTEKGNMEATR